MLIVLADPTANRLRIARSTGPQKEQHCVKSVRIRGYSVSYFPAFGLNAERYSECWKMRTRITPNTVIFYAVQCTHFFHNIFQKSLVILENKKYTILHKINDLISIFRGYFIQQLKKESLKFLQLTHWLCNELSVIIPRPSAKFCKELVSRKRLGYIWVMTESNK